MNFIARGCLTIIFAGFLQVGAQAEPALQPLPPVLRSLSDQVGVLSADEGSKLAGSIESIRRETGVRIIVVIAETTMPEEIRAYTERPARRWSRGRRINPARSIFVVLATREREMQVMPGRALPFIDRELAAPDTFVDLAPLFRAGRYFDALIIVNQRLLALMRRHKGSGVSASLDVDRDMGRSARSITAALESPGAGPPYHRV